MIYFSTKIVFIYSCLDLGLKCYNPHWILFCVALIHFLQKGQTLLGEIEVSTIIWSPATINMNSLVFYIELILSCGFKFLIDS